MKVIKITCFKTGKTTIETTDFHFSDENKASKIIVDFTDVNLPGYYKVLDMVLANGTYVRYDDLGTGDIVEKELTSELTISGYLYISPIMLSDLSPDAIKIKFQQKEVQIRKQIDSGQPSSNPRNDLLYVLIDKTDNLESNKLDKVVRVESEDIDILATLLQKANIEQINKLVKTITLDQSTGILKIISFDGSEAIIDFPLESIVENGYYDNISNEIVIEFVSRSEIRIPVSGLITQVNNRLYTLESKVSNIEGGVTKVPKAITADKLTTKEPKLLERLMLTDITASNDIEIIDNQADPKNAEILDIAGVGIKQVLQNSEAEVLTTKTPIKYLEGDVTQVVDGEFIVSNPKQIISKSNNLFTYNSNLLPYNNSGVAISINNNVFNVVGTATGNPYIKVMTIPANTLNGTYTLKKNGISGSGIAEIRVVDRTGTVNVLVSGINSTTSNKSFTLNGIHNELFVEIATLNGSAYNETFTLQLNEGTTVLPYQPFAEHIYDLPSGVELPKLPNGVGDRWYPNGVEKKLGKIILQESDILSFVVGTNINYIRINKPMNYIGYNTFNIAVGSAMINNYQVKNQISTLDSTSNIGSILANQSNIHFYIVLDKNEFDTLEKAKSYFIGKSLYYQLATPIFDNSMTLPEYIDTYTQGTIIVDNGQLNLGKLYSHTCQANQTYFVKAKLTDYTNVKVTNGTINYPLVNGYVKFTPTTAGEYWLDYVQDGINKISKAQWIEVYDPILKNKSADELNLVYGKFYEFGLTASNVTKLISSGDNWFDNEWELGALSASGENVVDNTSIRNKNYIKIMPNTQYTPIMFDTYSLGRIYFFDIDKNLIGNRIMFTNNNPFTTPVNSAYIRFDFIDTTNTNSKLLLKLSSNPETNYLSYTEDTIKIPVFDGRSLPNGVRNSVDMTRVGEVVFNGSENWYLGTNHGENTMLFALSLTGHIENYDCDIDDTTTAMSNVLLQRRVNTLVDYEGFNIRKDTNLINVRINKNKLTTQDLAGFKSYLADLASKGTPLTVWYQLDNKIDTNIVFQHKNYIAYNYGFEKLDDISYLKTKYFLSITDQVITNIENSADNRARINNIFDILNSIYNIEIYSDVDWPNVTRRAGVIYGVYAVDTKQITWYFGED